MVDVVYIGITGKAGSGKDTLCDYLLESILPARYRSARFALADSLKETCAQMYKVPVTIFNDRDNKEKPSKRLNGQSPREVLQQFGTEYVRVNLGADHWIKMVEKDIDYWATDYTASTKVAIIPDVRFENERNWIHEKGGYLIKIEREEEDLDVGEIDITHASEADAYKEYEYDFLVENNKSVQRLYMEARAITNSLGLS